MKTKLSLGLNKGVGIGSVGISGGAGGTFSISGIVTDGVSAVGSVTIALGSYNAVTASNGTYTITGVPAGTSGSLTATKTGYLFDAISIAAMSGNLTDQDFESPWYLAGGIAPSNVAAVWKPLGAADLAASYLRVAGDQGNANLDPAVVGGGVAPTFNTASGWTFNGTTQFLRSGVIPTDSSAMLINYASLSYTSDDVLMGQFNDVGGQAMFLIQTRNNTMRVYHGALTHVQDNGAVLTEGVYGLSGKKAFRNGVLEGNQIPAGAATGAYREIYLAANNYQNGTMAGAAALAVRHVAIYKVAPTDAQMVAVSNSILGKMLVAFGDSITAGTGASDAAHRWANLLATAKGWRLTNSGVVSTILQNTTQNTVATIGAAADNNGRDTVAARVTAYSPIYVAILYGLNDLRLNDAAITADNFETDLGEVVDAIVTAGTPAANIIIGSPPYMDPAHYSDGTPYNAGTTLKHQAYVAKCAAVATAKGTKYIDVYQWMIDNGGLTLLSGDSIHPNDAGHDAIADAFLSVL